MSRSLLRLPASLIALLTLLACSDGDGSPSSEDAGDASRPSPSGDATSAGDGSGADGDGADVVTPRPPPPDFATAWEEHLARIKRAAEMACPCVVSLGFQPSVAACASEFGGQIDQQAFCTRQALGQSEPNAIGYIQCMEVSYDRGHACFEALDAPSCTNTDPCQVPEAEELDCRLLLTAEQRASLEGCAPEESDR